MAVGAGRARDISNAQMRSFSRFIAGTARSYRMALGNEVAFHKFIRLSLQALNALFPYRQPEHAV